LLIRIAFAPPVDAVVRESVRTTWHEERREGTWASGGKDPTWTGGLSGAVVSQGGLWGAEVTVVEVVGGDLGIHAVGSEEHSERPVEQGGIVVDALFDLCSLMACWWAEGDGFGGVECGDRAHAPESLGPLGAAVVEGGRVPG